ncbi:MAG TPA: hypothetical protein VE709_01295 [Pseudonocardiaceae bacterium]|nr:hypothetical protein [Pseudonocardiaceae bacterium]
MRCGRPDAPAADDTADGAHTACRARAAYDPPRFCPACARRMLVQVSPTGWDARCSTHGPVHQGAGGAPAEQT